MREGVSECVCPSAYVSVCERECVCVCVCYENNCGVGVSVSVNVCVSACVNASKCEYEWVCAHMCE